MHGQPATSGGGPGVPPNGAPFAFIAPHALDGLLDGALSKAIRTAASRGLTFKLGGSTNLVARYDVGGSPEEVSRFRPWLEATLAQPMILSVEGGACASALPQLPGVEMLGTRMGPNGPCYDVAGSATQLVTRLSALGCFSQPNERSFRVRPDGTSEVPGIRYVEGSVQTLLQSTQPGVRGVA